MSGFTSPADIDKRSFGIIKESLQGHAFPEGVEDIVKRVIHTDFDYADSLYFPGM